MDNTMKAVFELSRDPMLAVKGGKIVHSNSRAVELFGLSRSGGTAVGIVPDHILNNPSDSFLSTAVIAGRQFSISAVRTDGLLCLSMAPSPAEIRPGGDIWPISGEFINFLSSSLFNVGLAIDRVAAVTEKNGPDGGRLDTYIAILNHSYYCLRHAILNLSTTVGLKRGDLCYSYRTVDLARLCSDLVSTVSVLCSGKDISISFKTHIGELFTMADGEKVERIILNLLANSLSHTPAGGSITVGLEKSGDTAYISVNDNGCGISPANMKVLFGGGNRENNSGRFSRPSSGGLGLGVARGLAEGHGGALIIESREGKGTSVRVMLPLRSEQLSVLEYEPQLAIGAGMSLILTELSSVLGSEYYTRKYLD